MAHRMTKALLALVVVAALASPAMAENVLRWASQGDALTYDPHSANESPTNLAMAHVYEALVTRDQSSKIEPCLAESWRVINPTTWEFKLRTGVKFHDGTPFTADDVAFTIARAKGPTSEFRNLITSI
ncbi:MAG TPA: ABC transporter substrate-binding protein, partial [Candidatus Sulfotelmatobacter sp.]|nr:ABC transporter substrate-binding protein [Candidatus Sulfotelmatobacter sp.]